MKNNVSTYRSAGLEARWSRTSRGAPAIFVRNPKSDNDHRRNKWWMVTSGMFKDMAAIGILEAFDRHTLIGDIFSITA